MDAPARYNDYSPGSGVSFSGWNAAALTVAATNQVNVTRTSTDGKYQLTEFIKINFQPRSIFVGMTVKNIDPANVTHNIVVIREVAPAIDGSAGDDQYNTFAPSGFGDGAGRTGLAWNDPTGSDMLAFGNTQSSVHEVFSAPVTDFESRGGCGAYSSHNGYIGGGNRVLVAQPSAFLSIAHNASVSGGKFVYRMM